MIYKSKFDPLPEPPPINVHDFFFNRPDAPQFPPDLVIHIDAITGSQRTREDFLSRVDACAREMCTPTSEGGMGLADVKDVMVGVHSDNSLDQIVLIHALLKAAIPFSLISSYSTPFELNHVLSKSAVTHLFVEPSRLSNAKRACKEKRVNQTLKANNIFFIESGRPHRDDRLSVESIVQAGKKKAARINGGVIGGAKFKARPVTRDTLAYLVFSSGTSGLPKAVIISHGSLIYSIMQWGLTTQEVLKFRPPLEDAPQACTLGFLPIYHSFGLHVYVFRSILAGAKVVVMPRWNLQLALECIPKYRVTGLALIPSIIHTMLHSPQFNNPSLDLSSITSMGSGAAYLPPSMARKFASYFPNLIQEFPASGSTSKGDTRVSTGWGMSEVTIAGTLSSVIPGMCSGRITKPVPVGSVGVLLPGVEARIVLPPSPSAEKPPQIIAGETVLKGYQDAKPGEVGELWVRGWNVALGYYKDEKSTRETFGISTGDEMGGGWLRSGDRFWIDEDGFLYFSDRSKDTLKISGMQVSPSELESFLLSASSSSTSVSSLITDVAVAGVSTSHSSRTEDELVPCAWVVPSMAGRALGERELKRRVEAAVKEGMSKYKWLRGGVEIVDEIPKNPTGKVLKRVLVDRYNARNKGWFGFKAKL